MVSARRLLFGLDSFAERIVHYMLHSHLGIGMQCRWLPGSPGGILGTLTYGWQCGISCNVLRIFLLKAYMYLIYTAKCYPSQACLL